MVSRTLASALKKAKNLGRRGDTMLAHINTREADILKRLGGSGTINPHTGLPEFADDSSSSNQSPSYSGSNNSNYTGGSDLGGYSGSGNTTYSSGGGGGNIGGTTTSSNMGGSIGGGGGGGGNSGGGSTYRTAGAIDASTNNYGGGSSSSPLSSAASSFSTALSAGAGTLANKLTSFSDTLNGILSDAQPSISSLGNQVSNSLINASDQLNAGLMNGYQFASDYISNALSPSASQVPSYTQMAALSGPLGLGQGVDAALSNTAQPSAPTTDYLGNMMQQAAPFGGAEIMSPFVGTPMGVPASSQAQMLDTLGINKSSQADIPAANANPSATGAINPDVSYALRYNPGTIANAEYIKGAQIKDQFPNVDFGGLSNTDVGRIVTRSIAGEAAREGDLGQQLVASNIMNRLALANQGFNSEGRKQSLSFQDVMKGYDANGFDANRTGPANSVYNNPSASTEWNAFNAMSTVLSPNSLLNQARTNPMAAMQLGAENNIAPEALANAIQSTHYYNPKYASPSWGPKMTNTAQIGGHLFGNLNTSPNAAQAMNSAMTGFNIPNQPAQTAQVDTSLPQSPASQFPQDYTVDAQKLVDDIFKNTTGASLVYSKESLINEFVKADPENVTYDPNTDQISIRLTDTNSDGSVDQQDYNAVIQGIKAKTNEKVNPNAYTTALGPPTQTNVAANPIMANMGIAQPPESPDVPMFSSANVADVPAPVAPSSTLAHLGVYDAPIGVNPNLYASPLNLPAQPNTVLSKAINTVIGLTPLGLPNTIAGLFGSGVGDMVANAANVPMTAEQAQEQMFANRASGNDGRSTQIASNNDPMEQARAIAKFSRNKNERWKLEALAWGFSEEQLADPEVADLIKQVYDLGFIPKTA